VANLFNTFVNPIALQAIGWKYYIVFIVIIASYGLTAYFFYPETRGHTLEQMASIFDGAAAADAVRRARSVASETGSARGEKVPVVEVLHREHA
jgi:hypothetical protein